jgi:hypothetical protein
MSPVRDPWYRTKAALVLCVCYALGYLLEWLLTWR